MSPPLVERATEADLDAIGELAANEQRVPERHIPYLPESAPEIRDALEECPTGLGTVRLSGGAGSS